MAQVGKIPLYNVRIKFKWMYGVVHCLFAKVRGWSLYSKLDSREIHWFLELDLELRIAERFANENVKKKD